MTVRLLSISLNAQLISGSRQVGAVYAPMELCNAPAYSRQQVRRLLMEAVQGLPATPSHYWPLEVVRIVDPTATAPLTALGQKLSCDPGLARTPPVFSDNHP